MKRKIHTEEVVIPILLRKGLVVKQYDYDEHNNKVLLKEIGIPSTVQCGNKINGKLDFMRKQGWKVMNVDNMTVLLKNQPKKSFNHRKKKRKNDNDSMKDYFKRNKKSVNLKDKNKKS